MRMMEAAADELWAHDTSNASTWRVADICSGTGSSNPGQYMEILVGDTLYFSANDGSSGHELWAMVWILSTASRTTEQRF